MGEDFVELRLKWAPPTRKEEIGSRIVLPAADGKLFMAMEDGAVACWGEGKK